MNFKKIQERILSLCRYVKTCEISLREGKLFAKLAPDFEALQKAKIINIEEELKWYAVELYNLEAKEEEKIRGYEIIYPKILSQEAPKNDEIYKKLTTFLQTLSTAEIHYASHLELDLGLDSIDYVELFIFVEQSFGVVIDEKIFASMMRLHELFLYIKKQQKSLQKAQKSLKEVLQEPIPEGLKYSSFIMALYKVVLFPLFKLYFRLEISGKENIPERSCIIAPSHQSMLDGFLIEASLPYKTLKNTFFLAYKNVFGTKFLKPIAENGQTILIDANENLKHTMQYVALPLKEQKNLVIFPEGARTRDRELLEFRPFFAMLSKLYNVPVVPVLVDGSFEALRSGTLFPKPKKILVRYLKPIYPEGLEIAEITQKTQEAIEHELKSNGVLTR